jgi:hypothetical protein
MSKLRFTDGTEVETAGQYRVMMLPDGFYVVGCGHMIPVRDCEEAYQTIAELKELEAKNENLAESKTTKGPMGTPTD